VQTAGHTAKVAIHVDNIEASSTHGLAPVGLLAEASVGHQAGFLVRFLQVAEVLSAALAVAVSLEAPKAAGALEALSEEAMEEATGKLKE
jgi:hypothetical protein